jgi:hypothetical protein
MECNVGNTDRIIRMVVGLVLIGLAVSGDIGAWGWIGLALVATGFFRFCPLYTLIKFKS